MFSPLRCLLPCCMFLAVSLPLSAQEESASLPGVENVRLDYARVLNVEPVYETLRAVRTEVVCEDPPKPQKPSAAAGAEQEGRWARVWNSVKGVFTNDQDHDEKAQLAAAQEPVCRSVPSPREFQRPVAYDVDYIYKGMKYRSRLAEDPGTRLRIRISVVPYLPAGASGNASPP